MKKYGFLFGAGAELAYNLPSGGQFALKIFRQDTAKLGIDEQPWPECIGESHG